jgi:hypothetical protein
MAQDPDPGLANLKKPDPDKYCPDPQHWLVVMLEELCGSKCIKSSLVSQPAKQTGKPIHLFIHSAVS